MKLSEVLHLYIGCPCLFLIKFPGYKREGDPLTLTASMLAQIDRKNDAEVVPILRRLESITEEDCIDLVKMCTDEKRHSEIEILDIAPDKIDYIDGSKWYGDGVEEVNDLSIYFNQLSADQFAYLLAHNYDLFGLIDSRQAIDAATLDEKEKEG